MASNSHYTELLLGGHCCIVGLIRTFAVASKTCNTEARRRTRPHFCLEGSPDGESQRVPARRSLTRSPFRSHPHLTRLTHARTMLFMTSFWKSCFVSITVPRHTWPLMTIESQTQQPHSSLLRQEICTTWKAEISSSNLMERRMIFRL